MRIKKIYLKNYRTHKEITLELEKGMNLLLGANGAGKSSILEAIGITLFDSKYRDGSSKGQKQVIKFGEKEALVIIEFVANDGETYIIENQIKVSGTGYTKFYQKDKKEEMLTSSSEIKEKLKNLVGIERGLTDIYDNIIVAKQNEFINLYKLKPTERKTAFNRIFETEIYEEIYKGYGKEMEENYTRQIERLEGELGALESHFEDINELWNEREEIVEKKRETLTKVEKEKEAVIYYEEKLKKISEIEKEIQILEQQKELYGKEIEKIDFQISENREEIRASKESKQILKELEKKYEKYEKLSQIIRGKREELQELEEKNEKYLEYTGELEVLERKKIEISSKNENLKNLIAEKKKLQENFEEQARRLREKIKDEMYSLERIEKEIVSLDPKIEISSKMEETRIKYEFNLKENQIQQKKVLENLEEKKISLAKIDLVKLEKEIKNLEQKNLEKEKIKNKIINIETLQKSNEEAKINLSSSICPFLNESCKNLGNLDVEKYFYEREKKYKNELEVEKEKLKKLEIELQNLNALKEEEILGKKLQIDIEKEENELEKYSLKKENIELHLIKLEREQKEFQEENGNLEKLKERKIQLQTQISTLNLEGTQKNLDWEEENLRKIAQEINEILLEREETEKNQEEIESFKEKCLEKISNFIKYNVKFQEESENFKSLQTELENLRESYDLYIKNYEKAQNLERLLEKEKDLEQEILLQKIKMEKNLNDLIEKVNSLPSKEEIENLYNIREKNKNSLENFIREVGMLERNEKELAEKITKAEIQREIYGKTLLKKKKLKEKLNLTKIFRNKVKNMGTHVAENIIREISFYATSNFRKITGRTESIEWSNLDPEGKESPYCVTLKGGDRNIIFEQLSGGEQVAVAIAIRGAMNNLFTRTAFAIFDEPTNNLDIERRKSLADNIGEILKDLEQSIIVTHDDTFREMAQKVIFLAENR